jgi:hypothetical protein
MKKSTFVSAGAASLLAALLAGCGLADVGASAATQGASAAEQVKQGKEIEAKVEKQVEDAQQAAREARDAAEAANNEEEWGQPPYSLMPVPRFMKNTATANSTTAASSMMVNATYTLTSLVPRKP